MVFPTIIYLCSSLAAFSSMLYELAQAQLLSATFGGTALRYATTIAIFTFCLGMGSWAHTRFERRLRPGPAFLLAQLAMVIVGALGTVWVASIEPIANTSSWRGLIEIAGYWPVILVGLISGFELPILMSVLPRASARVLAFDFVGMFLACAIFPFVLGQRGIFAIVAVAVAMNIAAAILMLIQLRSIRVEAKELSEPSPDPHPTYRRAPRGVWPALLITLSACSIGYELVLLRAISDLSQNEAEAQSFTLGIYLLGLGVGAWLCGSRRIKDGLSRLFRIEAALTVLGAACVVLVSLQALALRLAFEGGQNMWADWLINSPSALILSFQWISFAVGTLSGFELPLLMELRRRDGASSNGGSLAYSYIGNLIGGFAVAIILIPQFGTHAAATTFAVLNLGGCVTLLAIGGKLHLRRRLSLSIVTAAILASMISLGPKIEETFLKVDYFRLGLPSVSRKSLRNLRILLSEIGTVRRIHTPYQSIDLVSDSNGSDFSVFLNRHPQFSRSNWNAYHEGFAFGAINLSHHKVREVLILGGGDGLVAGQLLRMPDIQHITLVEIDPEMIRLARTHPEFTLLNGGAFDDPRVNVRIDDAYRFVARESAKYDAIFVDFPYPYGFDLLRLFSVEFYSRLRERIAPGGFVVLDAPMTRFLDKVVTQHPLPGDVMLSTLTAAGFGTLYPYGPLDPLIYAEVDARKDVAFNYSKIPSEVSNPGFVNLAPLTEASKAAVISPDFVNSIYRPQRSAR